MTDTLDTDGWLSAREQDVGIGPTLLAPRCSSLRDRTDVVANAEKWVEQLDQARRMHYGALDALEGGESFTTIPQAPLTARTSMRRASSSHHPATAAGFATTPIVGRTANVVRDGEGSGTAPSAAAGGSSHRAHPQQQALRRGVAALQQQARQFREEAQDLKRTVDAKAYQLQAEMRVGAQHVIAAVQRHCEDVAARDAAAAAKQVELQGDLDQARARIAELEAQLKEKSRALEATARCSGAPQLLSPAPQLAAGGDGNLEVPSASAHEASASFITVSASLNDVDGSFRALLSGAPPSGLATAMPQHYTLPGGGVLLPVNDAAPGSFANPARPTAKEIANICSGANGGGALGGGGGAGSGTAGVGLSSGGGGDAACRSRVIPGHQSFSAPSSGYLAHRGSLGAGVVGVGMRVAATASGTSSSSSGGGGGSGPAAAARRSSRGMANASAAVHAGSPTASIAGSPTTAATTGDGSPGAGVAGRSAEDDAGAGARARGAVVGTAEDPDADDADSMVSVSSDSPLRGVLVPTFEVVVGGADGGQAQQQQSQPPPPASKPSPGTAPVSKFVEAMQRRGSGSVIAAAAAAAGVGGGVPDVGAGGGGDDGGSEGMGTSGVCNTNLPPLQRRNTYGAARSGGTFRLSITDPSRGVRKRVKDTRREFITARNYSMSFYNHVAARHAPGEPTPAPPQTATPRGPRPRTARSMSSA